MLDCPVVVALCLTTTALGTLLPILRDGGVLRTAVGPSILSVGAVGEFRPDRGGGGAAHQPRCRVDLPPPRPSSARERSAVIARAPGHAECTHLGLPSRSCAGTCTRPRSCRCRISVLPRDPARLPGREAPEAWTCSWAQPCGRRRRAPALHQRARTAKPITSKLEAIGFGFLIRSSSLSRAASTSISALIHMPKVLLLVPMFTVLFLFTRGLPTWAFFRGAVTNDGGPHPRQVLSATGLPLIVVITTLGVSEHRMKPQNACGPRCRRHASPSSSIPSISRCACSARASSSHSEAPGLPGRSDGP